MLHRGDVVLHAGLLTLIDDSTTPEQALADDMRFLHDVLTGSGITFLLARTADDRPVLAVDADDRDSFERRLAEACQNEPFYSTPSDIDPETDPVDDDARNRVRTGEAELVADGRLSPDAGDLSFVVFRPRIDSTGNHGTAHDAGVIVEYWAFGDDVVVAPQPNALMRRRTPRADLERGVVDRFGLEWPTFAGMFDVFAHEIPFEIDVVFSWVDGASLEFQRARAKRMESYVIGEGDGSEARFRQLDELKYALRSIHLYAPWVRNIYIATDSPRPAWLADHPRVTIVPSEEMFADVTVLPTHNSHAVESQLHHISGLSEHFLYSNDDMFFGRAVSPSAFFSPGGITKFIEATTRIGTGASNVERSGFENAARVNRRLLAERFGRVITRHLEHAATPLRKSVMAELEREFPDDFARTAASRFRQATDISVTNSLYHYYSLLTGRAVVQTAARVKYVDTTMRSGIDDMRMLLESRDYDFFCLNDGSFPELSGEERTAAVTEFLESYYPVPAPWEVPSAVGEEHEPRRASG